MKVAKHLISVLFILIFWLLPINEAKAQGKNKGQPNSVVYVQEIKNRFQARLNYYCPVSEDDRFAKACRKASGHHLTQPVINPNVDWIKASEFKYMAQWFPAKTGGTYAWVSATTGTGSASIKNETYIARFAPGTVVVESFYATGSKQQREDALKRVRAVMAAKYGAVAGKMKYVHVNIRPVTCVPRKSAPKDGLNCTMN